MARAHLSTWPQRSPYAGAVSLGQRFGEGAPAPLSADKQSYRCADQNQKSRNGRHNAYLFKGGHDPPPDANAYTASKKNDRARLRLLSDCRHRGPKFLGTGRITPLGFLNWPPEPISGLTVFGIVPAVPARQPRQRRPQCPPTLGPFL
jgi:hypothetical protein